MKMRHGALFVNYLALVALFCTPLALHCIIKA